MQIPEICMLIKSLRGFFCKGIAASFHAYIRAARLVGNDKTANLKPVT